MLSSTIPYVIVRRNSKVRTLEKMMESEGELPCHWRGLWMCWRSGGEERSVIGERRGLVVNKDDVPAPWSGDVESDGTYLRKNRKVYFTVTIRLSRHVSFGISEFVPEIIRHGNLTT
jgi:hypothetical protein